MHVRTTSEKELELGAKLGAIIQDPDARNSLIENPTEVLAGVGVKSDVTLFADTVDLVHLIVPAEVDVARVAAEDETYFEELGRAALGNCVYHDLPE
ncbi:hypothetical protein [Roseibium album]|uniref:NHLP leader peptide family natural product n=1 Tax=Roseibium album TaxID=311410 RepID=A0A0M7B3P1_9HYPH|nr:hypothetical protein [Roseibium album]CTQ62946.1 hypothetical protein LA5094_05742 [Roseibium album]CTQ79118.1 hypothetical protein LA5096_06023 [Roseibium album]CTQ80534.1 hypothetical protein LA5095_05773 [Roseibium album]